MNRNITINAYNKTAQTYYEKSLKYAPVPEREKFVSLVKPGGTILDAGCGPGRDTNFFASHGYTATGIDLSEGLLSIAKEHAVPGATFELMDLRNITFPDNLFDGIWACASLLHLTHDELPEVFKKFHALLKENGVLFVMVKEGEGERMVEGGTTVGESRFFSYYSLDELKQHVEDVGFTVTDSYVWDQHDRDSERPHENWIALYAHS